MIAIPKRKGERVFITNCSDIFESFVLLRTTRFKNDPRGTWYFVIAIGKTSLFVLLTLAIFYFYIRSVISNDRWQIEIDPLTISASIVVLIVTFYWNERQNYIGKWEYLANLFNKHIEFTLQEQRNVVLASLAHDIHLTEMWGHRTYREMFADIIRESEGNSESTHDLVLTNESVQNLLNKYNSKAVSEFKEVSKKITSRQVNGF